MASRPRSIEQRRRLLSFVIVGGVEGGRVPGVEVRPELIEMARETVLPRTMPRPEQPRILSVTLNRKPVIVWLARRGPRIRNTCCAICERARRPEVLARDGRWSG
jgi:hypothetical protein